MHIEPGVVDAAKLSLSYLTAAGAVGLAAKMTASTVKNSSSAILFVCRATVSAVLALCFFEILPHFSAGVSEVHFIFGATLFLIFGAGPAAVGLAIGLGLQGLLFAPGDLPQFGMNLTTLLMPLMAVSALAHRIVPRGTAYRDITYRQALALSFAYQGGIVAWVAFWACYGQGFSIENLTAISSFAVAYSAVLLVEPVLELLVLWTVKNAGPEHAWRIVQGRVYSPSPAA